VVSFLINDELLRPIIIGIFCTTVVMDDSATELLLMFQKMGTSDRGELVKQFQTIVPGVDDSVCRFFLEANNWTLQNALASFFEGSCGADVAKQIKLLSTPKPQMGFALQSEPHVVPCGARFSKLLNIHNTGVTAWPPTVTLDHVQGEDLGSSRSYKIGALAPSTGVDITLHLIAPDKPGDYAGSWMCSTNGDVPFIFGEPIWIIVRTEIPPQSFSWNLGPQNNIQQPMFTFHPTPQIPQGQALFGPDFQHQLQNGPTTNPFQLQPGSGSMDM